MGQSFYRFIQSTGVIATFMACFLGQLATAQQMPAENSTTGRQSFPATEAICVQCHNKEGPFPVADIANTKHGTRADGRVPNCAGCHGPSAAHANDPHGAKPNIQFRPQTVTPTSEQNAQCLSCHKGGNLILWAGSTHESQDVACTSCHRLHEGRDPMLAKVEQTKLCVSCHGQERVQIHKLSRHPILEGKVRCSDCHNPHGSAGPKLMARDTVNDTCFQCHAEKRGPFIWNHQPVTESCSLCHEPHGSTVASMLKWRQPFLCQQCHEPTSHRGAIPSLTVPGTTTGTGSTLARSCVNCHTNIHGSNNPTNSAGSRSFRR